MKSFTISRKLFQAKIIIVKIGVKLKVSLLVNVSLRIHPLTFIDEALRLSRSTFVAGTASPWFSLAGVQDVLC